MEPADGGFVNQEIRRVYLKVRPSEALPERDWACWGDIFLAGGYIVYQVNCQIDDYGHRQEKGYRYPFIMLVKEGFRFFYIVLCLPDSLFFRGEFQIFKGSIILLVFFFFLSWPFLYFLSFSLSPDRVG